ncbi:MAG: alanine racemase [Myxococcales bacterium]|nr:alanine racemase [Myxococcales bacterium]
MSREYERLRAALSGERLPAVVVDVDALDRNVARHVEMVAVWGKPLRAASKSVRVVSLLRRVLREGAAAFRGVMCFAAREAEYLAAEGFDDFLLAYPPWQASDLDVVARLAAEGKTIRVAVDSREGIERIGGRAPGTDIVLCVDMSLRAARGRVHVGVRRSPLHDVDDVVELARFARGVAGVRLVGLLCYEAQVAGLGDASPFASWMNPAKAAIRRVSAREVRARRGAIVDALVAEGFELSVVNGGGTGSLSTTTAEPGITEVTAGSGFYKPHLFDYYSDAFVRSLEPACFFALETTRKPAADMITCLGGGYVASGEVGADRVPLPWLPDGLSLLPHEMCGEVQTPLRVPRGVALDLGAPVFFRHAKAGELMERFSEVLLVSGDRVVERAPTYRGAGQCYF